MNTHLLKAVTALMLSVAAVSGFTQNQTQAINVPLSRPGEPMSLRIDLPSARIEVIGEERKDAEFSVGRTGGGRKILMPSGAKSLPGGTFQLDVDENDNTISVDSDWDSGRLDIVAKVPRRANLDLSTANESEIIVRDIVGTLQLENANGPISATNINGSLIAESVNSSITATFAGIDASGAVSLTSMNGDVTLTLPAKAGAELRIDSGRGEIESEFELDVKPSKPVIQRDERTAGREGVSVRVEQVIVATVNGGGPVIRIKTLNGDLRIKKAGK
jgi:hypothetical protein